jgi:hypothetical protein
MSKENMFSIGSIPLFISKLAGTGRADSEFVVGLCWDKHTNGTSFDVRRLVFKVWGQSSSTTPTHANGKRGIISH